MKVISLLQAGLVDFSGVRGKFLWTSDVL